MKDGIDKMSFFMHQYRIGIDKNVLFTSEISGNSISRISDVVNLHGIESNLRQSAKRFYHVCSNLINYLHPFEF